MPMLYSLAFMVTFVIGGMTGIMLAMPPLDYLVHNTVFLVAHFHNMLIPGLLFAMLAAYHYWFPKAFGFRLNEFWGRVSFACWVVGFYLAFMPLYVLGVGDAAPHAGGVRAGVSAVAVCCGVGGLVLFCALAALFVQLWVSIRERDANRVAVGDPWDARGLEWSISAPPPEYNFAVIPQVNGRDPFYGRQAERYRLRRARRVRGDRDAEEQRGRPGDRPRSARRPRSGWSGISGGWRSSAWRRRSRP